MSSSKRVAGLLTSLFLLWTLAAASTESRHRPAFHRNKHSTTTLPDDPTSNSATLTQQAHDTTTPAIPEWKQALPAHLNNKTNTLQRVLVPGPGGRVVEVYLLGTAHVSIDSSRDVQLLLEAIQPNVIFLELCDQRIGMLVTPPPTTEQQSDQADNDHTKKDTVETKKGWWQRRKQKPAKSSTSSKANSMYGMAANMLTNMQQDYADSLGVELGGEFRVAYEYWNQHRGDASKNNYLHMILGDRPLYLTLTRAWESLGIWGKTKLLVGLLISTLQKPNPEELREWMQSILADDTGDLLSESMAELAQHFPSLEQVIIKERDAYMACKLYQTCRHLLVTRNLKSPRRHKLVAIVGAGHVEGMCRWLTSPTQESPEQVLTRLVQIKKPIPEEDKQILVQDVMEVNHQLLQEMAEEAQKE